MIGRIKESLSRYNGENSKPYRLEFSIGHKLFTGAEKLNAQDILSSIDELMYQNKLSKASEKNMVGQLAHFEYNSTQQ